VIDSNNYNIGVSFNIRNLYILCIVISELYIEFNATFNKTVFHIIKN